jgi:hypothetical protein
MNQPRSKRGTSSPRRGELALQLLDALYPRLNMVLLHRRAVVPALPHAKLRIHLTIANAAYMAHAHPDVGSLA